MNGRGQATLGGPGCDAGVFQATARDASVLLGGALYGAVVVAALVVGATNDLPWAARPALIVPLAVGLCWCANTVSHIQLHTPIFHARAANRLFTLTLTLLLGIPQTWWKHRHLRHHGLADDPGTGGATSATVEVVLLLGAWVLLAGLVPLAFFGSYLPAWLLGLAFCATQGHYEHRAGVVLGVDYHGRRYNRCWFNDGYHVQHHREPNAHWTTLASRQDADVPVSGWPPLLRWLGWRETPTPTQLVPAALDWLEGRTLGCRPVRWFLLRTHGRALRVILEALPGPRARSICIVGGGLFPRTALLLRRLLPEATLTIVDAEAAHLRTAARLLGVDRADEEPGRANGVILIHDRYGDGWSLAEFEPSFDLLVVPLAFRGQRERLYRSPRAAHVLVHDWMWRRRGTGGRLVSAFLLKRINWVSRLESVEFPQRSSTKLDTLATSVAPENPKWSQPCRTIVSPLTIQPTSPRRPAWVSTWWQNFARAIGRPS